LRDNLAIALPQASADQLETCAAAVWGGLGATLAEYARFATIADRAFDRHVEVVRHPGFDACHRTSPPCIFVTAHLGNWEIAAATARHLSLPLTVVYSPQANPVTEWLVQRRRRHLRCRFLRVDAGMRPLLRELHVGRSIGLLVDLLVKSGDLVPFCGRDTITTLVPAGLALKAGCPLVPVRVELVRPAHLRVTLYDPVLPHDGIATDLQARRMMARINALFESSIVARTYEWQCFQNRWPKSTPPADSAGQPADRSGYRQGRCDGALSRFASPGVRRRVRGGTGHSGTCRSPWKND
jgi:KDO2-lipid IV(A) lauroyltransferase